MQPDQKSQDTPEVAQNPIEQAPTTPEAPSITTPNPLPSEGRKRLPQWAKIVLISFGSVIGLIVLVFVGFFIYANSLIAAPMKVGNQFIDAAQANNTSAAYNLTSSEFKLVTKEERLRSIFEQINESIQGEEKVTDKHYRVTNGVSSATLIYSIPTNNETTYVRVVLKDKGGKWEVISMFTSKNELRANTN